MNEQVRTILISAGAGLLAGALVAIGISSSMVSGESSQNLGFQKEADSASREGVAVTDIAKLREQLRTANEELEQARRERLGIQQRVEQLASRSPASATSDSDIVAVVKRELARTKNDMSKESNAPAIHIANGQVSPEFLEAFEAAKEISKVRENATQLQRSLDIQHRRYINLLDQKLDLEDTQRQQIQRAFEQLRDEHVRIYAEVNSDPVLAKEERTQRRNELNYAADTAWRDSVRNVLTAKQLVTFDDPDAHLDPTAARSSAIRENRKARSNR